MTTSNEFSPVKALRVGWQTFKKEKKFWVLVALLSIVLSGNLSFSLPHQRLGSTPPLKIEQPAGPVVSNRPLISSYVPQQVDNVLGLSEKREEGAWIAVVAVIVVLVVIFFLPFLILLMLLSTAVKMGFMKLFLKAARQEGCSFEVILSEVKLKKAVRFIWASILLGLLIVLGFIFLIVPGIYFALKYQFVNYFIVDKDVGVREAFSLSGRATKRNKWRLMGLSILSCVTVLLGFLSLLYGLLVAIPVVMIAHAYSYHVLSRNGFDSEVS